MSCKRATVVAYSFSVYSYLFASVAIPNDDSGYFLEGLGRDMVIHVL